MLNSESYELSETSKCLTDKCITKQNVKMLRYYDL